VTIDKLLQARKQSSGITVSDEGMQTDRRDEQHKNANFPRANASRRLSKVMATRFAHSWKQYFAITRTDEGMQIDPSDEQQQNAFSSMVDNLEPGSNVT
jgi:ribosomal protein L11 methylase PrmA